MAEGSLRDIIVTVPKSRLAEVTAEEEDVARREAAGETDICYYWQMSRLPKECPERIYFVWNGAMRAFHEVISMARDEGRIYMKTRIHDIEPVPMKGFQGFRYFEGYTGKVPADLVGEHCRSDRDGDCNWERCPQLKDGEPGRSGRSCALFDWDAE